jgi:membrane protease YdiL (CAAX protease family)
MRQSVPLSAVAWAVTLLVSSLGDIVCFELTGAVPLWLLWAKVGLLATLILLSLPWKPIQALRPYFIVLLAITTLMRLNTLVLGLPGWVAWQSERSFAAAAIAVQLLEMGVALLLIAVLFALRKRRQRFFFVRGGLRAAAEPVRWLGRKSPGPLWRFGLIFTAVVMVVQFFMFIVPLSPSAAALRSLLPLVPVVLLLAVSNGFNEEIMLRAAPMAPLFEVVGKSNAIWMAAVLFGLSHYIGGIPSGIPGVLTTGFLGWFFGKCMLDSKGLFWPWLFHALQDILPFALMALTVVSGASR